MKLGIYLRVSTRDQNLDGQRAEIMAWLKSQGIDPDSCNWYSDKETGKVLERKDFRRMQHAIAAGEIDCVVVQRLDRVSRKLREGLNCIIDWLEKGVRLVAVRQQLDMSGAMGRLIMAVLLGVAEMENELRAERQAAGIKVAKDEDRRMPLGQRRYQGGYRTKLKRQRNGEPGWRKVKPQRVIELRRMGMRYHEIGRALGIDRATVWRYLRETECTG